jgi:excinuclease UvrABC helicase subunit UvrB
MRETIIYNNLCSNLGYTPTDDQSEALKKISSYICDDTNDVIFVLTGYAGTGKTSVISSVVRTLDLLRMRSVLLAPTGRAAKVLGFYSAFIKKFTDKSHQRTAWATFSLTETCTVTPGLSSMKPL